MDSTSHNSHLLHHLSFVLLRQVEQAMQEQLGIGLSQYRIMSTLQKDPYIQQRQIAKKLNQTEAAVSRQTKLLIDQGFIESTINPKNRRAHITMLTSKGMRFTEKAESIFAKTHQSAMSGLSDKQQKALTEALDIMHHHTYKVDGATKAVKN